MADRVKGYWNRFQALGFRGLLLCGIAASATVLLINVILLAVASTQPATDTGGRLLFRGDCGYASSRSTIAHLCINVLATLVLSASNAAMQCLNAPTREDLDRAHRRGIALDIGVASLRNLVHSDWFRVSAWVGLLLTSLPLHLVFNSVILQSIEASAYNTLIVAPTFMHGASTTSYIAYGIGGVPDSVAARIQSEVHSYTRLDWPSCVAQYSSGLVESWSDLVVLTDWKEPNSPMNSSVLTSFWTTPNLNSSNPELYLEDPEPLGSLFSSVGNLSLLTYGRDFPRAKLGVNGTTLTLSPYGDGVSIWPQTHIQECYAKPLDGQICTIELFQPFLIAVVLANILKLVCFVCILIRLPGMIPLVTFGDVVKTFLSQPDPLTAGGRAISRKWLSKHAYEIKRVASSYGTLLEDTNPETMRWEPKRQRWIKAVPYTQRLATFSTLLGIIVLGVTIIVLGEIALVPTDDSPLPSFSIDDVWKNGLGNIFPQEVFSASMTWSVGLSLLVANAPQLAMSVLFLIYNQVLTLMCVTAEAQRFSTERFPLRVSRPSGQQRSSYWLGLPLQYGLPLLVMSIAMHWALSQSIFIAEVHIVTPPQQSIGVTVINVVGYSIIGALLVTCLASLLVTALAALGLRKLPSGMPVFSCDSIAISAACHAYESSDEVAASPHAIRVDAERPLSYGVTVAMSGRRGRVGFSDQQVYPLESGALYGPAGHFPGQERDVKGPQMFATGYFR